MCPVPPIWRIQLRLGRGAGEPPPVKALLIHGGHVASLHLEGQFGQGSLDRVWSMKAMAVFCGIAVGKLRTGVQIGNLQEESGYSLRGWPSSLEADALVARVNGRGRGRVLRTHLG